MKFLIVTAWYHPFIHPRAHRWTALAKHWAATGHDVHVLTARVGDESNSTIIDGVQVHRVGFDSLKEWLYHILQVKNGRGRVGAPPQQSGKLLQVLEWGYKAIWKNLFFPDDACIWYFPAKRKMLQLLEKDQFDAIITVSLPFTDHLLGLGVKKKHPTLFWLADIGDPFSIQAKAPNNSWLYKKKNLQLERKVLAMADAVTVTTPATIKAYEKLFGTAIAQKISVVPPLLRPPEQSLEKQPQLAGINLGYFGALYAPTRTPDALLLLLDKIFVLRPELQEELTLHFYGEIFPEFYEQLTKRSAFRNPKSQIRIINGAFRNPQSQIRIRLHGLRSRAETWAAMQSMDILVNIGNTTDFQLPSKAVEYLAAGKPILNLSYVEDDPFTQFFEGNGLVFNLLVRAGAIAEEQVLVFLDWLESEKPVLDMIALEEKVRPFLVGNIADIYSELCLSLDSQNR